MVYLLQVSVVIEAMGKRSRRQEFNMTGERGNKCKKYHPSVGCPSTKLQGVTMTSTFVLLRVP